MPNSLTFHILTQTGSISYRKSLIFSFTPRKNCIKMKTHTVYKRKGIKTMFSCPNCGGNVTFDIPSQQLACGFCHEHFDPYSFEDKTSDAGETVSSEGDYEVTVFTCPQCGGEILSTDNAAAGFCSFCGASTILYRRISRERRPNYVIPFKKTKEDCKQAYTALMKHAVFAPKELRDPKFIDSFRGIYMPYWAFYITQKGDMALPATREYRQGNYIIKDYYTLEGELDAYYKGISYDASSSFDDSISETLAPYDLKGMKAFTPAYLSGFYADTADVAPSVYQSDAEQISTEESVKKLRHESAFSGYSISEPNAARALCTKTEYVDSTMLPVWFMSYRKNNRVAYVTVNGQTGKIAADIPIDPKKYLLGSFLLSIPLFVLLLFFTLLPKTLAGVTIALAAFALILYAMEMAKIQKKESGSDDRGKLYRKRIRPNVPPDTTDTGSPIGYAAPVAAILICALVLILHPISDLCYYGAALAGLLAVGFCIRDMIRHYNLLSTRRLPQFSKQGGDDRA